MEVVDWDNLMSLVEGFPPIPVLAIALRRRFLPTVVGWMKLRGVAVGGALEQLPPLSMKPPGG